MGFLRGGRAFFRQLRGRGTCRFWTAGDAAAGFFQRFFAARQWQKKSGAGRAFRTCGSIGERSRVGSAGEAGKIVIHVDRRRSKRDERSPARTAGGTAPRMGKARHASGLGGRRAPSAASRITLLPVWRQGKGDSLPGADLFRRGWKSHSESDALSGHRLAARDSYPPVRCTMADLEIRYAAESGISAAPSR